MRHVLVTGGTRGIGAAVARLAVARGAAVTVTYQWDRAAADQLVEELAGRAHAICADVADSSRAGHVLDEATRAFGPVEGLVNNAGTTGTLGPFLERSEAETARVFGSNVLGLIAMARAAAGIWVKEDRAGVIVNLSSIAAATGAPGEYVEYAASKAAVEALTRGMGRELASAGIRVVAVAPGTTDTAIHAAAGDPDRPLRVAARVPLGRIASPEEVAQVVLFALSAEASYLTATTITVAGGL